MDRTTSLIRQELREVRPDRILVLSRSNHLVEDLTQACRRNGIPVANPAQLIRAYTDTHSNTAYADYLEYRDHNRTLAGLAAFQLASVSLRSGEAPEHVYGMAVSGNYFDLLGVGAARGRAITREDDRTGAPGVVVLGDGFWRRRLGADRRLAPWRVVDVERALDVARDRGQALGV